MAHFAQLSNDGIVLRVIVVANADAPDEAAGIAFCKQLFGAETQWVQTSYNATMRRRFAGIGYRYDATRDAFITPQPFPSWVLDESAAWRSPIPKPQDGKQYAWNESMLKWEEVV
jgi:hypothetical protein